VKNRNKIILGSVLLGAIELVVGLLEHHFHIASYLSPDVIHDRITRLGAWAPVAYMAATLITVVIHLPSLPLDIAAGAMFGPVLGTFYSVTAATIGSVFNFWPARFLGRAMIEPYLKGHANFCRSCSDRLLTKVVFATRLIPVFSIGLISFGAGLTTMSARNFLVATFLGMVLSSLAYSYFGSIFPIGPWLPVISGVLMVAVFLLLPFWVDRYNLFNLKDLFRHVKQDQAQDDEHCDRK
jgi:uncharacterized membrane protein YdjX (TVP38/TMEM64 family)